MVDATPSRVRLRELDALGRSLTSSRPETDDFVASTI
jgi:hypothetical protein